ncbi:unnamed protein product [Protopolystoma xenopodis]|uniref:Uncharacterized protein n=1 Tax=Protopolystoma xenopodis TaxID=117903 RepID=A0A3S5AEH5_9PLAT|nr:unnamed protein product [Protopolystoma xenopodis]
MVPSCLFGVARIAEFASLGVSCQLLGRRHQLAADDVEEGGNSRRWREGKEREKRWYWATFVAQSHDEAERTMHANVEDNRAEEAGSNLQAVSDKPCQHRVAIAISSTDGQRLTTSRCRVCPIQSNQSYRIAIICPYQFIFPIFSSIYPFLLLLLLFLQFLFLHSLPLSLSLSFSSYFFCLSFSSSSSSSPSSTPSSFSSSTFSFSLSSSFRFSTSSFSSFFFSFPLSPRPLLFPFFNNLLIYHSAAIFCVDKVISQQCHVMVTALHLGPDSK